MSWQVLIQDFKLWDPDSLNSVTISPVHHYQTSHIQHTPEHTSLGEGGKRIQDTEWKTQHKMTVQITTKGNNAFWSRTLNVTTIPWSRTDPFHKRYQSWFSWKQLNTGLAKSIFLL